ncbi:MAG TPA: hypothetical protein VEK56_14950 [Vicinamibacterales bacterium]|nr:hypothetical protein [Vicinamibacterales bacterium]
MSASPGVGRPGAVARSIGHSAVSRSFRPLVFPLVALSFALFAADRSRSQQGNQTPQIPVNASPAQPAGTPSKDPAAATFTSTAGLLLVTVKADKTADYEAVIRALQEQLSKATDEKHRAIAEGWRVFKASDLDAKANAVYVHVIYPAVPEVDYRPSLILDELLSGASAEMLAKYRDAIASPPAKLGMTEFAHMAVTPVARPANASPPTPVPPKKPPV